MEEEGGGTALVDEDDDDEDDEAPPLAAPAAAEEADLVAGFGHKESSWRKRARTLTRKKDEGMEGSKEEVEMSTRVQATQLQPRQNEITDAIVHGHSWGSRSE